MKYLCLIYNDETMLQGMPPAHFESFCIEHLGYEDVLDRSGNFIAAEALQPVQTAATVRVRNGTLSVSDGPFAETKEQLGGFFLIDARDFNDAIRIAAKIPSARLGCVEVRPIREIRAPAGARSEGSPPLRLEHPR